jgi:eukaryotic-like serine/threonine-protein kinase
MRNPSDAQPELDALIADYLAAIQRGESPDREQLLQDHPAWADGLRAFFADWDRVHTPTQGVTRPSHESTSFRVSDVTPGTLLAGRYKLIENIGTGGMGTVWAAEQYVPVKRKVAVKLIKAGMDSRQVLARFEAERQALALMDHPHIAKVFDGGVTEQGHPFFVMEYAKGVPFTEYCDGARLSVKERLKLFILVCQAVQHAHHKGIVHRDLKPSNILVCLYDGQPVPKVIDFGLAKALHQPLTEHSLHTAQGLMLGTPLYMSPEQAEVNNLDVDTRTDIYSLGVVLYELLTGTTPLEKQQFLRAAYDEIRRLIRDVEPPKPSTRLSSTDKLPSIAAQRNIDPRHLQKSLTGDLDWIVMKALEKERSRRYETANGFARDIERYLDEEPVEACPPSTAYRLRKFIKKHRGQVIAASVVLVTLLLGMVGTSLGLRSAWIAQQETSKALGQVQQERDEKGVALNEKTAALAAEAKQRQRAEQARQEAETQRNVAEARAAETNAVLAFVENKILAAARPKGQDGGLGRDVTLEAAIRGALASLEGAFLDQPLIEARLRSTLGISFQYLGDPASALEQTTRAHALYEQQSGRDHPETLRSMHNLAGSYEFSGRHAEALALREATLEQQKKVLGPDHPHTLSSMIGLANSYVAMNRPADALALREATLEQYKKILGPDHLNTLMSMHNLALSYEAAGRHANALALREATLEQQKRVLGPDHPHALSSMLGLANSYALLNRHAEALVLHEVTLERRRAILGPDHPDTLASMINLANGYSSLNRHAEALALREATLEQHKKILGPAHPNTVGSMRNLAASYAILNRHTEAAALYEATLEQETQILGPDHPDTLWSMSNLANSYASLNRYAEAIALCDQLLSRQRTLWGDVHPEPLRTQLTIANCHWQAGAPAQAIAVLDDSITQLLQRQTEQPLDGDLLGILRDAYSWRAYVYGTIQQHGRSATDWDAVIALTPEAERPVFRLFRADSQLRSAQTAEALTELQELLELTDAGGATAPRWSPDQWHHFASLYALASGQDAGRRTELADRAMQLLTKAVQLGLNTATNAAQMANNTDLNPLRSREDFQKLMASLPPLPDFGVPADALKPENGPSVE